MTNSDGYYNKEYFDWQKHVGAFGGRANLMKFQDFIRPSDRVVDFGCGGGFLLSNVSAAEKVGIEINPHAREAAVANGLTVYSDLRDVPDDWADVIISNHALEHTENPLTLVRLMLKKLKLGGLCVLVVPSEGPSISFCADDVNQHLYTWSPQNLGNLFAYAGFEVLESKLFRHKWPRNYTNIVKSMGWRYFHWRCKLEARLHPQNGQSRVIAKRSA